LRERFFHLHPLPSSRMEEAPITKYALGIEEEPKVDCRNIATLRKVRITAADRVRPLLGIRIQDGNDIGFTERFADDSRGRVDILFEIGIRRRVEFGQR
jgi:hypothetical protein